MEEVELNPDMMRLAIQEARKNLVRPAGGPFGACIVRGAEVIAVARNTVLENDATCHAEVNAIRGASRRLKTRDLSDCMIYSTTEPCPMCFGAIHWSRIRGLAYGTRIRDVKKLGFNELGISNRRMKTLGGSRVEIMSGFLREECLELLAAWSRQKGRPVY